MRRERRRNRAGSVLRPRKSIVERAGPLAPPCRSRLKRQSKKTFFSELPRAIIYPFRGTGLLVLIVTTFVFAGLDILSGRFYAIFLKAAAIGYLFSYVQNIIHSTATGDDSSSFEFCSIRGFIIPFLPFYSLT